MRVRTAATICRRLVGTHRTVGRHALMPPPLPGRCADGSMGTSTPTGCTEKLHRTRRGGSPSRPSAYGRCADGSIRRSTPTNLHRTAGAAIGRPRQWKSQVPTRAHMQCAPTSRPAVLCSKGRLWVQFPVECGETTRFANSTADSLTVRLRNPPPFATMSAR